jgi:hypothetical protein
MTSTNFDALIMQFSLLRPNICLSTLCSVTLNLCSSLTVRDQVLHPHKTTGKLIDKVVIRNIELHKYIYGRNKVSPVLN